MSMIFFEPIIKSIKVHEGFRPKPYPDPETGGEPYTFGYGFTSLTRDEADCVLEKKLGKIAAQLLQKLPMFISYPRNVQNVLIEMAYQLGVGGLLRFKKMIAALDDKDYDRAALEIKKSRLYKQTPARAKKYMKRIVGLEE